MEWLDHGSKMIWKPTDEITYHIQPGPFLDVLLRVT
ncbi:hypothetical protein vseg_015122 [Gypsophila vaccaria]